MPLSNNVPDLFKSTITDNDLLKLYLSYFVLSFELKRKKADI